MTVAALRTFSTVLVAFAYDRAMYKCRNRWSIFLAVMVAMLVGFLMASNNLREWIISHLTLDWSPGYFRLMIWDAAFVKFSESWYLDLASINWAVGSQTALSIWLWLVFALRFGVPAVAVLCLPNIAAFLPPSPSPSKRIGGTPVTQAYTTSASIAFTVLLSLFE